MKTKTLLALCALCALCSCAADIGEISDPISDPLDEVIADDETAYATCNPVTGGGCTAGLACYFVSFQIPTHCTSPGPVPACGWCGSPNDCRPGHYCSGDWENPGRCVPFCDASHPCASGFCRELRDAAGNPVQGYPGGLQVCTGAC